MLLTSVNGSEYLQGCCFSFQMLFSLTLRFKVGQASFIMCAGGIISAGSGAHKGE